MNYKWDDNKNNAYTVIWMIFFLSAFQKKYLSELEKILSFEKVVLLRNVVIVTNYSFGKLSTKLAEF
jgi:hypothetical protein